MKNTAMALLWAAASAVCANPVISPDSVVLTQPKGGTIKVAYTLANEAAVVTVDFLTNGVSIGEVNFTNVAGDVNRKVEPGERMITWRAYKTWPDHKIADASFTARVTAWPLAKPPDYLVVDLTKTSDVLRYYVSSNAVPGGVLSDENKTSHLVMRKIHASAQTFFHQIPIRNERRVSFTNDYYIGVFELTQGQYVSLGFPSRGSYTGVDRLKHPLETTSLIVLRGRYNWPEGGHADVTADSFIGKLQALTLLAFDLPTETQWEFAARAGSTGNYFWGSGNASEYAHVGYTAGQDLTFEVGLKRPSPWGLYDIHGNVLEHTLDRCVNNSSPDSIETLPKGHFFEPEGWPKSHSSCCTTKGGKAASSTVPAGQRNRVNASEGYYGNGFRLVCPALVP